MVYGIIKNHEGEIICQSKKEQGTQFDIYLPGTIAKVEKHPKQNLGQKSLDAKLKEKLKEKLKDKKILIVDDEKVICDFIEESFGSLNIEILSNANGKEGWETFNKHHDQIALVILDLIMPIIGGISMFKKIRKSHSNFPVLFLSGFSESEQIRKIS